MQTTTFRTKNLFHCTTVIVQKNPDFGFQWYDVFDVENMNSADCRADFRVEIKEVVLSEVRVSVEWLFRDIINYFRFLDYKKNLKISLSSVGSERCILYVLCCEMPSFVYMVRQMSEFFDLEPPINSRGIFPVIDLKAN